MAASRLNDLAERKRALIVESDLHRTIIAVESSALRQRLHGASSTGPGRWWWLAGSVVSGWIAGTRWDGTRRTASAFAAGWDAWRRG